MKILFTLIALLSQPVLACNQSEALFVAQIVEINNLESDTCLVSVEDFSYFREHALCPLSKGEISSRGISLAGSECDKSIGDILTGVAILNGTKIVLD